MAQQCRQRMQLVFAANEYAGKMPGDFVSSEASEDSAERYIRVDRRNRGPKGFQLMMQQNRERYVLRDPRPSRRERKRENKRENDRDRKRDRKDDHKRDRK